MRQQLVMVLMLTAIAGCHQAPQPRSDPQALEHRQELPWFPPRELVEEVVTLVHHSKQVRDVFGELDPTAFPMTLTNEASIDAAHLHPRRGGIAFDRAQGMMVLTLQTPTDEVEIEADWSQARDHWLIDSLVVCQPATGKSVTVVAPAQDE